MWCELCACVCVRPYALVYVIMAYSCERACVCVCVYCLCVPKIVNMTNSVVKVVQNFIFSWSELTSTFPEPEDQSGNVIPMLSVLSVECVEC